MDTCVDAPSTEFCAQLTACLPRMRSFARFLCRREDLADDLVQDTVVRALTAAHQFQPGSNFKAWIFTIMHNQNISNFRRKRPQIASTEVDNPNTGQIAPNQIDALILRDLDSAMRKLAPAQREALVLVVVNGLSYEDAAQVCNCAIGTIKSRVARARTALQDMLMGRDGQSAAEDGPQEAASLAADRRHDDRTSDGIPPSGEAPVVAMRMAARRSGSKTLSPGAAFPTG